jgi:hypothetical protein
MPPLQPIKTYVPEKTQTQAGPNRERGGYVERNKLPMLIRAFIWLLVFRSVVNLIFGLTLGLAPDTSAATYILANFDPWPKAVSAEAIFYITALIYGVMAWRWYSRDWRARWAVMFASGATAAKLLVNYAANQGWRRRSRRRRGTRAGIGEYGQQVNGRLTGVAGDLDFACQAWVTNCNRPSKLKAGTEQNM